MVKHSKSLESTTYGGFSEVLHRLGCKRSKKGRRPEARPAPGLTVPSRLEKKTASISECRELEELIRKVGGGIVFLE